MSKAYFAIGPSDQGWLSVFKPNVEMKHLLSPTKPVTTRIATLHEDENNRKYFTLPISNAKDNTFTVSLTSSRKIKITPHVEPLQETTLSTISDTVRTPESTITTETSTVLTCVSVDEVYLATTTITTTEDHEGPGEATFRTVMVLTWAKERHLRLVKPLVSGYKACILPLRRIKDDYIARCP